MSDIYTIFNHSYAYGNFGLNQLLCVILYDFGLIYFFSLSLFVRVVFSSEQMIRNSMSWFLRPKWPLNMAFIRNESIKAAADHISWKIPRG